MEDFEMTGHSLSLASTALDQLRSGSTIEVEVDGNFAYVARCKVIDAYASLLVAEVCTVFDKQTRSEITGGEILDLIERKL